MLLADDWYWTSNPYLEFVLAPAKSIAIPGCTARSIRGAEREECGPSDARKQTPIGASRFAFVCVLSMDGTRNGRGVNAELSVEVIVQPRRAETATVWPAPARYRPSPTWSSGRRRAGSVKTPTRLCSRHPARWGCYSSVTPTSASCLLSFGPNDKWCAYRKSRVESEMILVTIVGSIARTHRGRRRSCPIGRNSLLRK